ncbi:zinc-ribbon domain containing protein [Sorangium sp. So ce315]|uniref:zinc-ribbon domain containing protein n=1 Tax=Sorangium sp. So ce315 TaxID=3133299 RepID=UPI003F5D7137
MARRQSRRDPSPPSPEPRVRGWDSEFGALRLIERTVTTPEGRSFSLWDLHPDDVRKLPRGAVRADVSRQVFGMGGPVLFYVDRQRRCRTCGEDFVFRATEQRYWYETLRFLIDADAVDCARCRREIRQGKARAAQHAEAVAAAHARPDDARAQLTLAASTCALREHAGGGDVDAGIAAARRALRLNPSLVEALYHEGGLQAHAGRPAKAREALEAFLKRAEGLSRREVKTLVRAAQKWLERADAGDAAPRPKSQDSKGPERA